MHQSIAGLAALSLLLVACGGGDDGRIDDPASAEAALDGADLQTAVTIDLTQVFGTWVSSSDTAYRIEIREAARGGYEQVEQYDGEDLGSLPLIFVEECGDQDAAEEITDPFYLGAAGGEICQRITALSETRLEVAVPGRPDPLRFTRAD